MLIVGCANKNVTPSIDPAEHSCLDEKYLELKNKDIEEMTDREFKYFITKDEECLSYTMSNKEVDALDYIGITTMILAWTLWFY